MYSLYFKKFTSIYKIVYNIRWTSWNWGLLEYIRINNAYLNGDNNIEYILLIILFN